MGLLLLLPTRLTVSFVYMLYHMDVIGVPKEETFFSAIAAVEAVASAVRRRRAAAFTLTSR